MRSRLKASFPAVFFGLLCLCSCTRSSPESLDQLAARIASIPTEERADRLREYMSSPGVRKLIMLSFADTHNEVIAAGDKEMFLHVFAAEELAEWEVLNLAAAACDNNDASVRSMALDITESRIHVLSQSAREVVVALIGNTLSNEINPTLTGQKRSLLQRVHGERPSSDSR
jgi:hypothetical protein